MNISVRKAAEKDITAMMQLIKELALYERALEQVTVTDEHFRHSLFGANPVCRAFVAENENNEIVGLALYYIRYSTWKGQRMYLEDIIVTDACRGMGIGSMLMDALITEAKEKGFSGIVWQVLDWNEPAINFYKKYPAHFDPEWINVSMEL